MCPFFMQKTRIRLQLHRNNSNNTGIFLPNGAIDFPNIPGYNTIMKCARKIHYTTKEITP